MPAHVFIWLLMALTLSLLLSHLRHRRQVAAEIMEGADDARNILDSSAEGIIVTNDSGIITKFNLMAEQILGYKADNVIGKNFLLLLPVELHQIHQRTMSGPPLNVTSKSLELMARRSDGTTFPLSLTVKSSRQRGMVIFLGMIRDISERMQTEATSRNSQQLMEFLLKSSPIVFYTCNIEAGNTFTYVSPNVEELLGYQPESITSASAFWQLHVHPDDRDQIRLNRSSHLNQGRENLEYRLKVADGNYRWIADSRTMVNDENGNPNLLIGRWTDIQQRKDTEIQLALKDERLRVSLKCAKMANWDWRIDTGKMSWSEQINEILGVRGNQLVDFDEFDAITHPEDHETLLSAFRQCLVLDEPLDVEYRILWPDKSIHWVHLMGELINDEAGSPVRMVGALSDLTAQKQLRVAPLSKVKRAS